MADNKFIERLKGESTAKSKVQIDNDVFSQPYDNFGIIDQRNSSIVVARSAENFGLSGTSLLKTDDDSFTSSFDTSGTGAWINASYTYPASTDPNNPVKAVITPSAKFVLRLVGANLFNPNGDTVSLTVLVKTQSTTIATKTFALQKQGNDFCHVLEFDSTLTSSVKINGTKDLTVQVLCGTTGASATIYNGKTVLSILQRRIDADAIASDNVALIDVLNGQTIATDMFSNPDYIEQVEDGESGIPQFTRDDDTMNFSGWKIWADKQDKLTAGTNIQISSDNTISATDTTYTAGTNITISNNTISATDTTYTAGTNVSITNNVISATDTTYTAGNGLTLTGTSFSANVENNVTSTSTTNSLSANMGKELQQQINHLVSLGRFLSFWNCTTGLPETSPQTSPYTYKTGDWFRVGTVASGSGTNYKPSGTTYTTGVASTTVETESVIVGQVYYFDGSSWSLQAGGGTTSTDDTTIHYNTDNNLEVIGVKDTKTSTTDKLWTGTLAEYNALSSKDSNTFYHITDDETGGLSVYTKTEIDALFATLYPVGSVYIGTQATCPMTSIISGSTWTLVSSGKALWTGDGTNANTTIAAGLPNITSGNATVLSYKSDTVFAWHEGSLTTNATVHGGLTSNSGLWVGSSAAKLDASTENSIYGNSTTVQPPAYVVNVWRRTA